jgi:galactose mutarotase-like enzyme
MVKTELRHRTWGHWPSVVISTEAVELEVVSEVGARVVSLRDKRRDRQWLVQGEPPAELEQMAWAEDRVTFDGRSSFGWDECLPTTSVCADPLDPDGPDLRDHGDQWGRGAYLRLDHEHGAVEHSWSVPCWDYRMHRRLSFADEEAVLAEYMVESHSDEPLPMTWAQHPVLAVEPGSYIDLPTVSRARRSWQHGIDLPDEPGWPKATTNDGQELDLGCVGTEAGWAAVLYADAREGARVVTPDGARLDFEWDRDFAPALRVWLAYGGWPPGEEAAEQIALEPCTSEHDHLAGALEAGQERVLPPRGELRWWVRLRLS